jgi:CelD/BcsL family acetyltransferase involved in cellulose biosynthesis
MAHLDGVVPDEIGYLFYPARYGFRMENFWRVFPGKSRKKLITEIEKIKARNLAFRFNHLADLEAMFQLNLNAFEANSYFYDNRFHGAFERLAAYLWDANMLRITTVLIEDKIAAVDMGAIFNHSYTILAGGTNPEFPGIAKAINLHHLEWSCGQRFEAVDFLCGDFNWKQRFRLTPRPLVAFTHHPAMQRFASHRYHDRAIAWA